MLNIEKYVRKPFYVDMVTVTAENMAEVAEWCGGTIEEEKQGRRTVKFIKVPVVRPMSEKQTKAFVKDKVLKTETGAKVYTEAAFHQCFESTADVKVDSSQDELPLFEITSEDTARQVCGKTKNTIDHRPCILDADHGKRACSSIDLSELRNITGNPKFPSGYPSPSNR